MTRHSMTAEFVHDNWAYAASSDPALAFPDVAEVDRDRLTHQPESPLSRSLLAGIACNQRNVGLSLSEWHSTAFQVSLAHKSTLQCNRTAVLCWAFRRSPRKLYHKQTWQVR